MEPQTIWAIIFLLLWQCVCFQRYGRRQREKREEITVAPDSRAEQSRASDVAEERTVLVRRGGG